VGKTLARESASLRPFPLTDRRVEVLFKVLKGVGVGRELLLVAPPCGIRPGRVLPTGDEPLIQGSDRVDHLRPILQSPGLRARLFPERVYHGLPLLSCIRHLASPFSLVAKLLSTARETGWLVHRTKRQKRRRGASGPRRTFYPVSFLRLCQRRERT
jgi:hypothetical protein